MRRECRERFDRHGLQRKPLVCDPGMHHSTCFTHALWCRSGSLTRGAGKTFPAFPAPAQPTILRICQEAHCVRFCKYFALGYLEGLGVWILLEKRGTEAHVHANQFTQVADWSSFGEILGIPDPSTTTDIILYAGRHNNIPLCTGITYMSEFSAWILWKGVSLQRPELLRNDHVQMHVC